MIKGFPIDYIRQTFEQTLLAQRYKSKGYFFGGKDQVRIFSLYEQLLKGEDVDRYVENFRDLQDQQNRCNLIMNGVLSAPSNPTITNLYSCTIIPMEYVCSLRVKTADRDQALETINNMIEELKGTKVDIAELKCRDEQNKIAFVPFVVGTIGHNEGEGIVLENGNFIGQVEGAAYIDGVLEDYQLEKGVITNGGCDWLYCEHDNKVKVAVKADGNSTFSIGTPQIISITTTDKIVIKYKVTTTNDGYTSIPVVGSASGTLTVLDSDSNEHVENCEMVIDNIYLNEGHIVFDITSTCETNYSVSSIESVSVTVHEGLYVFAQDDGAYKDIIFPPTHESFEKWKLSLSIEALRCDDPKNLNGEELVAISFGGSATLQNARIRFGNDMVKVSISKIGYNGSPQVRYQHPTKYWLEPLETPANNSANTKIKQLVSNRFINNSHTDALSVNLQYSFVADAENQLIDQWFKYARYGTQNTSPSDDKVTMTPNLLYDITEWFSWWGNLEPYSYIGKKVDSVDNDTTEGDTMTISVTMQKQGEND